MRLIHPGRQQPGSCIETPQTQTSSQEDRNPAPLQEIPTTTPRSLPRSDPYHHQAGDIPADVNEQHVPENAHRIVPPMIQAPSWASGDTVPVTPNTLLQNFRNQMPIGAAVSTDISASTATTSVGPSPQSELSPAQVSCTQRDVGLLSPNETETLVDVDQDGVITRGMALTTEKEALPRGPRPRFELTLTPRMTSHPIAANHPCYILHPGHGNCIVAEGRTGGSWKSPSQKLGSLCKEGEQMVQIHKVNKPNLPLPILEERQPFTVLEHALVKPAGSSVYVKWPSKFLWKKPKTSKTG